MTAPDTDTLRRLLAALKHGPVSITGGDCRGDSRAVNALVELFGHIVTLAEEVLRLRAIVEGRTVPPTDAEIAAHCDADGWWLVSRSRERPTVCMARMVSIYEGCEGARYVALDSQHRPCPWPEVKL